MPLRFTACLDVTTRLCAASLCFVLLFTSPPAAAVDRAVPVSELVGKAGQAEGLPSGDLFRPLIADPKQPQFFVSVIRFRSSGLQYTMASVAFGEMFGLYRFVGSRDGNGLQLSLEGALFAQFNLSASSLRPHQCGLHHRPSRHLPASRQFGPLPRLSPELAPGG
jgi:Protein of unknown function (DUF1207)